MTQFRACLMFDNSVRVPPKPLGSAHRSQEWQGTAYTSWFSKALAMGFFTAMEIGRARCCAFLSRSVTRACTSRKAYTGSIYLDGSKCMAQQSKFQDDMLAWRSGRGTDATLSRLGPCAQNVRVKRVLLHCYPVMGIHRIITRLRPAQAKVSMASIKGVTQVCPYTRQ